MNKNQGDSMMFNGTLYNLTGGDRTTTYLMQLSQSDTIQGGVAELLPVLLDRLVALGDLAKEVSLKLGGNGYRGASELEEILSKKSRIL